MGDFKLRRGLRNVYAAEVTKDEKGEGGFVVGTPFHLIPAGEMTRSAASESANTWFDDGVFATVGTEGATEIKITGASLRADALARLLGKTVDAETGAVIDNGKFTEKYFAIGGEARGVDGSVEYFWFMKGTFAAPEESDKTIDDGTDANGMELTFTAISTIHEFTKTNDICKRIVIDTNTSELLEEANWVAQVVTPDNIATIAKKKTV